MPRRTSLLLTLLLAACAPAARAPVPPLGTPEGAAHATTRLDPADVQPLADLLRMEDTGRFDAALVTEHLRARNPEVRARAAVAAARSGDRGATPLLLQALGDSAPTVRARAAFALGELADSAVEVSAALTRIALRDVGIAAIEAVAALGRIATEAGRPAIDSILSDTRHPAPLRHEALLVAWRLPRNEATIRTSARWLGAPDAETRWRAAYALGARAPAPSSIAPLLQVVADADPRVRMYAVRGLRAPLADSARMRDAALNALRSAAADPHPHVRINAIGNLAAFEAPSLSTPVLAAALRDADANVAVAAANALAQSGDRAAAGALREATAPGRPDGLRGAALAAWVRADTAGAAALAREWSDSTRWILRVYAARTLAHAGWPAVRAPLLRLARDAHYLVSAEALSAIRTAADTQSDARPIFIERLGAEHALVRAAAARGLARMAGPGDLDVLLNAYMRAQRDTDRDAAVATVAALARLRRLDVPVERAFFLRFGQHEPTDPALFRAIRDSIGTPPAAWGEPTTGREPRPDEFYSDVIQRYVAPTLAGAGLPRAVITTEHGDIELELAAADAPLTVHNFVTLIERGYYEGTRWHRVVPNFVIQDGDPRGDGSGGPGYAIRDEINPLRYDRGALGMALAGPHTGGAQFFITHSPQPHLDGGYTVFGRVRAGMDVVDRIVQDDPIHAMRIIR